MKVSWVEKKRAAAKTGLTSGDLDKDVDTPVKELAPSFLTMTKKEGGGASRRGSHKLADNGGCEVKWYWSHFNNIRAKAGSKEYADFGTLVHTGLAYHYASKLPEPPPWMAKQPDVNKALEEDSLGRMDWLTRAHEIMDAYRFEYAGEAVEPVMVEEELSCTVGVFDPEGDDEPAEDIEYVDPLTKETKVWHIPTLNDEILTGRIDIIVKMGGHNWVWDHKTGGAGKKDNTRLPIIDPRWPDYTYIWQTMYNLRLVRHHMPARGYMLNRVKRTSPYDFKRDQIDIPDRMYEKVPRIARAMVRNERAILKKCLLAPGTLEAHPWECKKGFECDYVKVCFAETVEMRNLVLREEFQQL